MEPNPQETADLVQFTEENLDGKLHFLSSDSLSWSCYSQQVPFVIFNSLNRERNENLIKNKKWIFGCNSNKSRDHAIY